MPPSPPRPPSNSATVYEARSFNGDVSQWNVAQVKDMSYMCKLSTPAAPLVLSAPRDTLTSSSPSTSATVSNATSFNGDVSQWDVGQVKDMNCMCTWSFCHHRAERAS